MNIERTENVYVGLEIKDGKLFAVVHLSDCNALFRLEAILDEAICGYELFDDPEDRVSAKAKPLFDAMRKDLAEMIERIDALRFA